MNSLHSVMQVETYRFLSIPMIEWFASIFQRFHYTYRQSCLSIYIITILTVLLLLFSCLCALRSHYYFQASSVYLSQTLVCPNVNQNRVEYGRKHFFQSRVIICGLLRDREPHIQRLKEQLHSITQLFADYAIVFVENDSKDGTRHELIKWANADSHVHVLGCDNLVNSNQTCTLSLRETQHQFLPETSRIQKMVRLRNIYLNYIENHTLLKQFDYVLVEDFDLTSYTYLNGFFSTGFYLKNDSTIDAICSNGVTYKKLFGTPIRYTSYFDPYAHKDEENKDWSMAYNDIWSQFIREYSCNEGLIPVQSCFSGRTIYRLKSLQGKRYRTYLDRKQLAICEHVGLHETFNKMYLNSEMFLYITKNNIQK